MNDDPVNGAPPAARDPGDTEPDGQPDGPVDEHDPHGETTGNDRHEGHDTPDSGAARTDDHHAARAAAPPGGPRTATQPSAGPGRARTGPEPDEPGRGRSPWAAIGGGLAMITALAAGGVLLFGTDRRPPAPPPAPADAIEGIATAPGAVVGRPSRPPQIRFDLAPRISFEASVPETRDDPWPERRATVRIIHVTGDSEPLAFENPAIVPATGNTVRLPEIDNRLYDCEGDPRAGATDVAYCHIGLIWQPVGPGTLSAELTIQYRSTAPDTRLPPGTLSIVLTGTAGQPAQPPILRIEPELLAFTGERSPGQPQELSVRILLSGREADVTHLLIAGAVNAAVVSPANCIRRYQPGATTADYCDTAIRWIPELGQNLQAELRITMQTAPDSSGRQERYPHSFPVTGQAGAFLPALVPDQATIEIYRDEVNPVGFTARGGDIVLTGFSFVSPQPTTGTQRILPHIDAGGCPAVLAQNRSCTINLTWINPPAGRLPTLRLNAGYEFERKEAHAAVVIETAQPVVPMATVDPAAIMLHQLRMDLTERRNTSILNQGVGVVTGVPLPGSTRREQTGTHLDPDYASINLPAEPSTRPVWLAATILRNTPIPAVLTSTIDSKLEVPVTAIVERHVYAAHGRAVVIPRGSKAFGMTRGPTGDNANPSQALGMLTARAGRLQIDWERITRPDGTAFLVRDNVRTLDSMGRPGVLGHIDHREAERYLTMLASAGLDIGLLLALEDDQGVNTIQTVDPATGRPATTISQITSPEDRAAAAARQAFGDIARTMAQYAVPPPTLTVPRGTRIQIMPITDLWLRPAYGHLAPAPAPGPPGTPASTDAQSGTGPPPAATAVPGSAEQTPSQPLSTTRPMTRREQMEAEQGTGGGPPPRLGTNVPQPLQDTVVDRAVTTIPGAAPAPPPGTIEFQGSTPGAVPYEQQDIPAWERRQ